MRSLLEMAFRFFTEHSYYLLLVQLGFLAVFIRMWIQAALLERVKGEQEARLAELSVEQEAWIGHEPKALSSEATCDSAGP